MLAMTMDTAEPLELLVEFSSERENTAVKN